MGWVINLTPGKETRYPFYRRLSGPQGCSGRARKISRVPFHEIVSKSMEEIQRPRKTLRLRVAYWISKATCVQAHVRARAPTPTHGRTQHAHACPHPRARFHDKRGFVNAPVCYVIRTRWFKYNRDKLWLVYTQSVPVIFEPPCTLSVFLRFYWAGWHKTWQGLSQTRLGEIMLGGVKFSNFRVSWRHSNCDYIRK
jgi:hypothetical protein